MLYVKVLCCHIILSANSFTTVIRRQKSKCVNVPEIVHAICKKHSKNLIEL